MRAVLCKQFGPPESLVTEEVPSPRPGAGEVLVSVKAAGVSFPDVLLLQNKYQYTPVLPFSPGGELSGIVKSVGEGVSAFKPGDAVIGRARAGCAEEAIVPVNRLWHLPSGIDFNVAAGFSGNYSTSYMALRDRAQLQPGETLLVLGASGGVGLAAVDLGRMMGARVIACASSAEKLAVCKHYGADELVNYDSEDLHAAVMRLTSGKGVDVAYDPVGDKYAEPAVRSMGWNGRYLIVGFAAGAVPKISFMLPFEKRCALMGVFAGGQIQNDPQGAYDLGTDVIALLAAGKIRPHISAVYPMEKTAEALRALMTRQVVGKVVVSVE